MRRFSFGLLILSVLALNAYATPILGTSGSTFAILGFAGVTGTVPVNTITGNIGGGAGSTAITGYPAAFSVTGTVYQGAIVPVTDPRLLAQSDLGTAITALSSMTPTLTGVSTLDGLVLTPGVYQSSSTMNLDASQTLTLDGKGNANALWVFQVGSGLNTFSSSVVNVINSGPGAGVYWVLPTTSGSAVLGSNSTFLGNILANIAINVNTNVTDSCGSLLTQTASVTLAGKDTIGIGCAGGGTITGGVVTPLPFVNAPEPPLPMLLSLDLLGLIFLYGIVCRWKSGKRAVA